MIPSLHEEIFSQFKKSALELGWYPAGLTNADHFYLKQIKRWQDIIEFRRVILPEREGLNFDIAWILTPVSRPGSKRKENSIIHGLIAGLNTSTGRLVLIGSETTSEQHKRHTNPDALVKLLADADLRKCPPGFSREDKYDFVQKFLGEAIERLGFQILSRIDNSHRDMGLTRKEGKKHLRDLAATAANQALLARQSTVIAELDSFINHEAMAFAEEFNTWSYTHHGKHYPPIAIYNHLICAASPEAIDYRKGALKVLAPMRELYLGEGKIWSMVDDGQSVFAAVGAGLGRQPATIRRIIKNAAQFVSAGHLNYFAEHLDRIDPSLWPQTSSQVSVFNLVVKIARVFGAAYTRTVPEVLDQWVKESRSRKQQSWEEILQHQLARQIENQIQKEKSKTSKPKNEVPLLIVKEDGDDGVVRSTRFFEACFKNYEADLANIGHMKSDLRMKLLRASIILGLETRDAVVTSPGAIKSLEDTLAHAMWLDMPPSEQIAASGYWHSPRVNFRERFQSIAYSANQSWQWATLFSEPLKLQSGIELHPLNSTAMLREEANAMAHCVWSYSHNCMANAYHIFSVRDQNGHRLTTLTVQDFFEGKARKIKLIEHKGHHNAAPTGIAAKAADQLLAMVNDGKDKLKISWQAIDESKAEFLAQQVDNSVGYDFRNPEQRERVFELYEPCLSRKILRRSHRTFDGFFGALDLDGHIEQFLASRDAEVGGLIASKVMREATRPMINGSVANNVDQPAQGIQNG